LFEHLRFVLSGRFRYQSNSSVWIWYMVHLSLI